MIAKFITPEEEVFHLRAQLKEKIEKAKGFEDRFTEKDHAHEVIREYKSTPIEKIIEPNYQLTVGEKHKLIEWLSPKETDEQVKILAQIIADKGIKNAIVAAEGLNNPEIEDDFERFLVQYIISGHEMKNDVSKDIWRSIHMKLFEIVLPETNNGQDKQMKEMMALMEQWYASMQALAPDVTNKEKNYYTLELSVSNGSTIASFYCAVHVDFAQLFEKVVTGIFPTAQVRECKEDYNIFHNHAISTCSYATHSTHPTLPIKIYEKMSADPMS
jgi:hypothetical protein